MNFNYTGVRYWGENFKKFNHFDIIHYKDVVEAYIKTSNELKPNHEKFGWNERPINSDVDNLDVTKNWNGFDPVYFNIDPTEETVVMAKADVISMDMSGVGNTWDKFLYLTLPYDLINKYMTNMHDNEDVSIARKFITEVEDKVGWDGEEWKNIEKKYDELYPAKSQYTDLYETHTCIKWKQDFDIRQYISIKKNGLLFPICYNSMYHMLRRGTHRAVLLAMTKSDVPIFLQVPNEKHYKVTTPKFFGGKRLEMWVDINDKKLDFNLV